MKTVQQADSQTRLKLSAFIDIISKAKRLEGIILASVINLQI
ncbi:protein of unknown function [Shewanella benthica]|uniref:Uncharacterized protein n=1 Tax=Shewanella benthica TaxID=43661 RepID=A0A330M2U5_9GAMM|nr:protein of unknown function [Shewanella benthica]